MAASYISTWATALVQSLVAPVPNMYVLLLLCTQRLHVKGTNASTIQDSL